MSKLDVAGPHSFDKTVFLRHKLCAGVSHKDMHERCPEVPGMGRQARCPVCNAMCVRQAES